MSEETLDVVLPRVSVLGRFRAFWQEVETFRASVTSHTATPAAVGIAGLEEAGGMVYVPASIRDRLIALLEGQQLELGRRLAGPALRFWREAEYVMVAAADELFVTLAWTGAAYWQANLLETKRYGSRSAGQSVFDALDRLLERADPNERELAAVYLTALALGFRGKYVGREDDGAIDRYKRELGRLMFGKAVELADPFRALLPQCYDHTTDVGPGPKLRSPRIWWWAVAGVMVVWIVVSHVGWSYLTRPIHNKLSVLRSITDQLEPGKR